MWNELKITDLSNNQEWQVEYSGIKNVRKKFPYCDKDGNEVKSITIEAVSGKEIKYKRAYKSESGTILTKAYKLINEKAVDKFSKTKEIKSFTLFDRSEIEPDDLDTDKENPYYVCKNEILKRKLKEENKIMAFVISLSAGNKPYNAVMYVNNRNQLIMKVGFGSVTQQAERKLREKEESKEIEQEEVVDKITPEEMLLEVKAR